MSRKPEDTASKPKALARDGSKTMTGAGRPQSSIRKDEQKPTAPAAASVSGIPAVESAGGVSAASSGSKDIPSRRSRDPMPKSRAPAVGRTPRGDATSPVGAPVVKDISLQRSPQRRAGEQPIGSLGPRPPGLFLSGPSPDVDARVEDAVALGDVPENSGDLLDDSFDEEVELLTCEAELVEAAADTTSADDDYITTDQDFEDDDYGIAAVSAARSSRQFTSHSIVIEEDDEGISSGMDDIQGGLEADSSEMRSRLWAQSLLRLKRSIDEIYSLCEFESDEVLCKQVRAILDAASGDFGALLGQFDAQQEYSLLGGEYPFKSGIAWTSRTRLATPSRGGSALEVLERLQPRSPSQTSPISVRGSRTLSSASSAIKSGYDSAKRRAKSLDPMSREAWLAESSDANDLACVGTGELGDAGLHSTCGAGREEQLEFMVQSALRSVHLRLGRGATKLSPEEISKKSEDRQRRAQQLRASQDDARLQHVRQLESRILKARERREQREQQMQQELVEKMTRARRQYQDQLRIICDRARKENRKTAEVHYIHKESLQSDKEMFKRKHENAHLARVLKREEMRKKLIESANRVAQVSETRRRQLETWQDKVQQDLDEKERLAAQRRQERINTIRTKTQGQESRTEMVQAKRKEIQEEDERQDIRGSHLGHKLTQLSCCDSLPDGVREEVAERLSGTGSANLRGRQPATEGAAGCRRHLEKRSKAVIVQTSSPQVSGSYGASSAQGVAANSRRAGTPPRRPLPSPKGSPCGAATDGSDGTEAQLGDTASVDFGCILDASPAPPDERTRRQAGAKPKSRPQCQVGSMGASAVASAVAGTTSTAAQGREMGVQSSVDEEPKPEGGSSVSDEEDADDDVALDGVVPEMPTHGACSSEALASARSATVTADLEVATSEVGNAEISATVAAQNVSTPGGNSSGTGSIATARPKPKAKAAQRTRNRNDCEEKTASLQLEALRAQLVGNALSDEEALKLASEPEASTATAVNAAHRARISKLATDLGKVSVSDINLDKADAVLGDFCKVLGQSQREADYALVLQLGCANKVIDMCASIKNSIEGAPPVWKQMSAVMLSALKWLGLLSKHKMSRVYMLVTNRVVPLVDIAITCLNTQAVGAMGAGAATETQNVSLLFLPQVLHILSLHVKQSLPDAACGMQQRLVSYLLLCGLPEKLRDLFRRAEVRGMRLFDGASPVPLLLLRAMGLLGTMLGAYRLPAESVAAASAIASQEDTAADCSTDVPKDTVAAAILRTLRQTELFGVVSVLLSILLSQGRREIKPGAPAPVLPQTVVSLAVQVMRLLNHVARLDLATLQETMGTCRQQELYHLMVCLFEYCSSRVQGSKSEKGQDESELLHETIVLLGYYCLRSKQNQSIMCYGEGQSLLAKIASLPLHYFMEDRGRHVLFPTILATCYGSVQNLELLRNEMNLSLLWNFLTAQQAQDPHDENFLHRFPAALWADALDFFADEAGGDS